MTASQAVDTSSILVSRTIVSKIYYWDQVIFMIPHKCDILDKQLIKNIMKKVAIYTTPTCVYCVAAKKFFNENSVKYEEYNVATDMEKRKEMVEETGQMGVPVIKIDEQFVVGFNQPRIKELLGV